MKYRLFIHSKASFGPVGGIDEVRAEDADAEGFEIGDPEDGLPGGMSFGCGSEAPAPSMLGSIIVNSPSEARRYRGELFLLYESHEHLSGCGGTAVVA